MGSTPDAVLVCTDDLLLEIGRADCRVHAEGKDGSLLLDSYDGNGYFVPPEGGSGISYVATPDEHYYGLGEKVGPLDKRGRAWTFWNTDAYNPAFGGYPPDADPLYQSIPFFIGLRGDIAYGVFLDDTRRVRFDMAAADPTVYTLTTPGPEVDLYLIAGPAMNEVVRRYTSLTGRMPLPPRWSLGYHQSRWGYTPEDIAAVVKGFREDHHLPADSIWLDIQHMDEFRSFTWDPQAFPDPGGFVADLGAQGFKTVVIVDPGIKVDDNYDVYADGVANGYFLLQDGAPYVGQVWPPQAVFPDFSAPAVRTWWAGLMARALDKGVAGVWIDMNEPSNSAPGCSGTVPDELVCAGDGVVGTMAELHNVYAFNEARATYDGMVAAAPDRRPFILTRAGFAGIQRYAAVWTGDAPSTWDTLAGTLPMLLGMGLSGLSFSGSDVGGYSGNATPELFARWMQLGALSPFFRGHVTSGVPSQEPWAFGTEARDISRSVMSLRYELLPYLYSLFEEAHETGAPVLRPLVYEFQGDPQTATRDDEAMLGRSILFAPVLKSAQKSREVYLPEGRWYEYFSGAVHDGPTTFTVGTDPEVLPLAALPTFVRAGAIVPRQDPLEWTDQNATSTLYLDAYPAAEATAFVLYEDDGVSFAHEQGLSSKVTYTLQQTATGATLSASPRVGTYTPPPRTLMVRVRRVDHGVSSVKLSGQALASYPDADALAAAGTGYFWDDRDLSLVVRCPDQPGFEMVMEYDTTLVAPAPAVSRWFRVQVPQGTSTATPIHIVTGPSWSTQQPLTWDPGMTSASGLVSVPRGDWVFYKYTRGGWSTVEKWPSCAEATNRYELGKAHPDKVDTVWGWADWCP